MTNTTPDGPWTLPTVPAAWALPLPTDPAAWVPPSTDPEWVAATVHTDRGPLVGDVRFDTDRPALVAEELIEVRVPTAVRRYRHHWVPIMELQEIVETQERP